MSAEQNKTKRLSRVREMKNDLILEAAFKVFTSKGYHETRLEDVAAEAGFSKASLYNYYKDKEDIFLTLLLGKYQELTQLMMSSEKFLLSPTLSLEENLRHYLALTFEALGEHFSFLRTSNEYIFNVLFTKEPIAPEDMSELQREMLGAAHQIESFLIQLFQAAQDRNEIGNNLSAEQLYHFFQALHFGIIAEWRRNGAMGDIQKSIDDIVSFMLWGCQ